MPGSIICLRHWITYIRPMPSWWGVHYFIVLPSLEHHPGYRKFSISTKEYVTPIEKSNAKVLTELRTNHSLEWFLNQFSKSTFQRRCLTGKWQPSRSNIIHSFILQGYHNGSMKHFPIYIYWANCILIQLWMLLENVAFMSQV